MKMEGHRTKFQGVKQNTNREQLELVRIRMDDSINKLVQEEKRMSVWLKLKERSICFLVFLSRVDSCTLDFNNRGALHESSISLPFTLAQTYGQLHCTYSKVALLLKFFEVFCYEQWNFQSQEAWQKRILILPLKTLLHLLHSKWTDNVPTKQSERSLSL